MKSNIFLSLFVSSLFILPTSSYTKAQDELTGKSLGPQNARQDANDSYQGTQDQAQRFYSSGSLKNPDSIPADGYGFVKILRSRARHFGTYDLTKIIQATSAQLKELYPSSMDRVQVGDISDEDGGLQSPNHASHQNGLDVDIAFIRKNQSEQDPSHTNGFEEIFVQSGKVTENFDKERNWNFVKFLVHTGRVQRIFVNQVIKNTLCAYAKSIGELEKEAESLRRLRPYTGHMDHFHVRITCPQNSPSCESQEEVPSGLGC